MSVTPSSTIVGIFTDRSMADQAMQALYNAGFTHEQIRYSVPGTSGGILEDIKSLFTGTSTSGGNLANDLTSMGLSDEEAGYYANEYNNGKIILAVSAKGREQDAMNILHQYGAYNPQTRSGSNYETPNYAQQPSNYTQQGNYAPYETPPQQEVRQNWPAQPLSHTPEEHSFEDHQQDRVTPEASTEDQATPPVTSEYDSEAYSTQANIVTPGSETGDQASQTGTTAPEHGAENQSAQSDVATHPEIDYQAQQTNAATSESWTDYQAPQISTVTSVEEIEDQSTPPVEVPSESPADYEVPQANAVTTEQEVGTQASQPDQNTSGHVDELQQLLEQLQTTQQQLQEAKAQLQAAKDHEVQIQTAREREQQLQTARQQLQDIQAELQATLAELRETQARIEQYQ